MLINCRFNSAFLNFLLKLEAMCLMQKTEERPSSSQATFGDCNVDKMTFPLLVIRQIFG